MRLVLTVKTQFSVVAAIPLNRISAVWEVVLATISACGMGEKLPDNLMDADSSPLFPVARNTLPAEALVKAASASPAAAKV